MQDQKSPKSGQDRLRQTCGVVETKEDSSSRDKGREKESKRNSSSSELHDESKIKLKNESCTGKGGKVVLKKNEVKTKNLGQE